MSECALLYSTKVSIDHAVLAARARARPDDCVAKKLELVVVHCECAAHMDTVQIHLIDVMH